MLNALLCKANIGHHWVAEADQDGNFQRHCVDCGKVDPHPARWSGRVSDRDHRAHDGHPAGPGMH